MGRDVARVGVVLGTRPELIKLAPVVHALAAAADTEPYVIVTGQHPDLLRPLLELFAVEVDATLSPERRGDGLGDLVSQLSGPLESIVRDAALDALVVQGDTTTTLVGALVGAFNRLPVFHVEAGLRSGDPQHPFPEEHNRRLVSVVATRHLAPTDAAAAALLREGHDADAITVTGNTVIDALRYVVRRGPPLPAELATRLAGLGDGRRLLVTMHRRESWGDGIASVAATLRQLLDRHAELSLVWPVHPNPAVRRTVVEQLGSHPRAALVEPLGYGELVAVLRDSWAVVTDSGGLQEEAPSLGVPVLVCRETTERPEAIEAGTARLVGTAPGRLVAAFDELWTDARAYERMARAHNPFGDGRAADRVVAEILHTLAGEPGAVVGPRVAAS